MKKRPRKPVAAPQSIKQPSSSDTSNPVRPSSESWLNLVNRINKKKK